MTFLIPFCPFNTCLTAYLFISTASKVVLFDAKTNNIMLFTNKEYIKCDDPVMLKSYIIQILK